MSLDATSPPTPSANGAVRDDRAPRAEPNAGQAPSWRQIDWREHQRWLVIDGRAVNTIVLGEGPPILFVHGLSGCWGNWLEQMAAFAQSHRVVAVDLPGFGHSPGGAGELSMEGYAALLDELLGELGIARASVVGNSMGGLIAAELAAAFPQRVERLVLISAAGISTYQYRLSRHALPLVTRFEQKLALAGEWAAASSDVLTNRPRLRELALKAVVRHPRRLPAALAAEQVRGAGTDGFLRAATAIYEHDVTPRLGLIACPTLIVWGDRDLLIDVRDAARFHELIAGSKLVVYEDTGHMSMLERPREFNELLAGFLAG
jgi:pimeloyl-ACP methyl ester carboxylesterase